MLPLFTYLPYRYSVVLERSDCSLHVLSMHSSFVAASNMFDFLSTLHPLFNLSIIESVRA